MADRDQAGDTLRCKFASLITLPHGAQVHCIDLPSSGKHLITGAGDGFVRRYDVFASLNGTNGEISNNCLAKVGGHGQTSQAFLKGYWPNLRHSNNTIPAQPPLSTARFGQLAFNGILDSGTPIPIHSICIEDREAFCVTGDAKGSISLYGVRHDEGQLRARFLPSMIPSSDVCHLDGNPISSLALNSRSHSLLSGGWDTNIFSWDLNTGACQRGFKHHTTQLSFIAFRPISDLSNPSDGSTSTFASLSVDGQLALWDYREERPVHLFRTHSPPWAVAACWSKESNRIAVGRRNAVFDIYDIRAGVQSFKLPTASGAITALAALGHHHRMVVASEDNVRFVDYSNELKEQTLVENTHLSSTRLQHFRVFSGYHGGNISALKLDKNENFIFAAMGDRGWRENSVASEQHVVVFGIQ